jgi:hypothetical protein
MEPAQKEGLELVHALLAAPPVTTTEEAAVSGRELETRFNGAFALQTGLYRIIALMKGLESLKDQEGLSDVVLCERVGLSAHNKTPSASWSSSSTCRCVMAPVTHVRMER